MKKFISILIIIVVLLMLFGCISEKMAEMPKYNKKECYYGEGFQDYTDYCKYFYDVETLNEFKTNTKFKKITESDIEDNRSYFQDFENRINGMISLVIMISIMLI